MSTTDPENALQKLHQDVSFRERLERNEVDALAQRDGLVAQVKAQETTGAHLPLTGKAEAELRALQADPTWRASFEAGKPSAVAQRNRLLSAAQSHAVAMIRQR